MRCTATTPVPHKAPKHLRLVETPARPAPSGDAVCGGDGHFCRCWMPAWFHLAEIVAEERRGSDSGASAARTA